MLKIIFQKKAKRRPPLPSHVLVLVEAYKIELFGITCKIENIYQNMFFHEWAPYGRWGGHRTVEIQVVAMRVFLIRMISHKKTRFFGPWTFHDFSDMFRVVWRNMFFFPKNDPEVSGSARGASPTYPGPYLTNFDENRLKHNYYKKSI